MNEAALPNTVDDLRPIASYFGVDPNTEGSKLSAIARNLKGDSKDMDEIDIMKSLRDVMWKLGEPPLGSSHLQHAYEYAKLDNQIRNLQEERQRYVK
jgi:hypothetical protein